MTTFVIVALLVIVGLQVFTLYVLRGLHEALWASAMASDAHSKLLTTVSETLYALKQQR